MDKDSRMSNSRCKEPASKRSVAKKYVGSIAGKENDPLPSGKSRAPRSYLIPCGENRGCDENVPRGRVPLSKVEFKREDSRSSLAVVNASKTPFHVHSDEKNEETKETCSGSNRIGATKPASSVRVSKIPVRKPASSVRSRSVTATRATAPPLKEVRANSEDVLSTKPKVSKTTQTQVPALSRKVSEKRSSSTQLPNTTSRLPKTSQAQVVLPAKTTTTTRKTNKVPNKAVSKEGQSSNVSSKSSKPGGGSTRSLSTLRLRTGREYVFKRQVSVTQEIQKNEVTSNSEDTTGKRIAEGVESVKISWPAKDHASGATEESANSQSGAEDLQMKSQRRSSLQQERIPCIAGSVVTPIDGPPPAPLMPVKELIKRAKRNADTKKPIQSHGTIVGLSCPVELAYHMEYHNDLIDIEKERDDRAPRLSDRFLRRHINAHQRKEIVAYLIHLGVHCRYPSFAIYQTVKLFDAAIDRLALETDRMQLTALAALWICLKRLEVYRKIPSADTILALANEMYLGQEELLMAYERKILQAVDFNITFADMFALLSYYIIKCKLQLDISAETTDLLYTYGAYMIDLTMLDERFCRPPASLVAFIVSELAMVLVQDSLEAVAALKTSCEYSCITIGNFTPDNLDSFYMNEMREVNRLRAAIVKSIRDSGNKRSGYEVVYRKYNRSRYGCISKSLVERAKRLPSLDTTEG